jgi:alanine racemase
MNRLGMGLERLREISIDLLDLSSEGIYPSGILSHLALAEDAAAPLSLSQKAEFEVLYGELAAIMPDSVDFHLSNSAAIWNHKKWAAGALTRRVRPGLALYGIESEIRKLQPQLTPVLNLEAPVILLHELHRGEALGYGGRFVAEKRERIATLGIGYAEGIPRAWSTSSSDARVLLGGKLQPFTGTISMDLCAVRASTSIKRGDWARILGEGIDPWKQARAAGTIPYELLTSISRRVQRIYE